MSYFGSFLLIGLGMGVIDNADIWWASLLGFTIFALGLDLFVSSKLKEATEGP